MSASKIEWTDRSDWNPIRGCTRISPGCGGPGPHGGCYAEAIAARFSDPGQAFHGFAERTAKGPRWTGKVEIQWDRLDLPLRWRKEARIFASSTSDFFHEALVMTDVAQLFGVMIAAHHLRGHTFQVLTKRADRMRAWLNDPEFWDVANAEAGSHIMERVDPLERRSDDARATCEDYGPGNPPPGIWLGVSVEDQARADERVPALLATPAAARFLSCEPLLGPVDLGQLQENLPVNAWLTWLDDLDWVIAGGESGPKARPMHPNWARALRDQCEATGTAFHFKQWGEWGPDTGPDDDRDREGHLRDRVMEGAGPCAAWRDGSWQFAADGYAMPLIEGADTQWVYRLGKKRNGRDLDGRTHDEFPA